MPVPLNSCADWSWPQIRLGQRVRSGPQQKVFRLRLWSSVLLFYCAAGGRNDLQTREANRWPWPGQTIDPVFALKATRLYRGQGALDVNLGATAVRTQALRRLFCDSSLDGQIDFVILCCRIPGSLHRQDGNHKIARVEYPNIEFLDIRSGHCLQRLFVHWSPPWQFMRMSCFRMPTLVIEPERRGWFHQTNVLVDTFVWTRARIFSRPPVRPSSSRFL